MKAIACALTLVFLLTGCTAEKRISGVSNTFLEDVDITAKIENLPFDHAWIKPGVNGAHFDKIYVKPIRVDKLPAGAWKNSISTAITSQEDYYVTAAEIAEYFHERIEAGLRAQQVRRYQVVNKPGPDTLVLAIALTELEFSHPIARAGALAVPVPGTGAALSTVTDPHVAFAARITDGETGELIATAADRKFPPARIVDLNKLTATSSAREVCSLWADIIAQGIQGNANEKLSSKRFSLLPW